jgi:hypothetical protein
MKKFLSTAAIVATMATAAMAAPTISTNGMGDFLIAPAYFATNGYSSKVRVINTDLTHSVLVRVVVRDSACSNEVDFPVLLSPGDVWDATIYAGTDGNVYIKSTDDSNYLPQLSTGDGLNLTAANPNAGNGYASGYVEIYPVAEFDEGAEVKVDKAVLKDRWNKLQANDAATLAAATAVDNILTGFVTLTNEQKSLAMTLPMTAINDASDAVVSGVALDIATNTTWDSYFGTANTTTMMTLLQASNVVVPFVDGENVATFTFVNDGLCGQLRGYKVKIRDTQENKPLAPSPEPTYALSGELAFMSPMSVLDKYQLTDDQINQFKSGWIKMVNLTNVASNQGSATPSFIATQMKYEPVGSGATNWMYIPKN